MIKPLKKNLKRQVKLTTYFQMKKEKTITINLAMLLSKVVVVVKVLEGLILHLFQIFLKIFLEILEVVELQEEPATEEMI